MQKAIQAIGHRGGRVWAPENTMAAFRLCLEHDIDGIELDVQRCSTGELVVMHDPDVGRTTNGVGQVREISLDELKRLSAGLWFDKSFAQERVPTLQDVLDLIDGQLTLHIEVKNTPEAFEGIEEDLLSVLSQYARPDLITVSSFDHQVVKNLHDLNPELKLAILCDGIMVDMADYATLLGASLWHPNYESMRADVIESVGKAGIVVNTWPVNEPRDWAAVIKMGVDGIITDDPLGLKKFLARVAAVNDSVS